MENVTYHLTVKNNRFETVDMEVKTDLLGMLEELTKQIRRLQEGYNTYSIEITCEPQKKA